MEKINAASSKGDEEAQLSTAEKKVRWFHDSGSRALASFSVRIRHKRCVEARAHLFRRGARRAWGSRHETILVWPQMHLFLPSGIDRVALIRGLMA